MFRLISMIFIEIPDAFGFIRGFAVAFAGVAVFAVILDMPRHLTVFAGLIGAVGYAAYLIAGMYSKLEVTKVFWAMIVVAFLSHILARQRDRKSVV